MGELGARRALAAACFREDTQCNCGGRRERQRMANQHAPKKGEFYLIDPDTRGGARGHGITLSNADDVPLAEALSLPAGSGGLKALAVMPQLRFDVSKGELPLDLQGGFKGYWLVSDSLKRVLESVDPDAVSFARCEYVQDIYQEGEARFLCEVVRTLDAIDEAASVVNVRTGYPGGKYYSLAGGARLAFHKDVTRGSHIFMDLHSRRIVCDRVMRDALVESGFGGGEHPRGVWLEDAADY